MLLKYVLILKKQGMKHRIVRFFNGKHEGKFGYIDISRSALPGRRAVNVMENGLHRNATVSVWNIANLHPLKPRTFAEAVVMQKPLFEKELKLMVKKIVKMGINKNDDRLNSFLDLLALEVEHAQIINEYDHEVKYID